MKKLLLILSIVVSYNDIYAQTTTNEIKITGKVKAEKTVTFADLQKYATVELNDINISCSPKKEDKVKSLRGVLVKNILDSVAFQYEKTRMLNRYYFLFIASDGYKIVFSFNEVYNTEVGNNLYIVTGIEGEQLKDMDNSLLLVSIKDIKSGGRNMKWLSKIVVCSAD